MLYPGVYTEGGRYYGKALLGAFAVEAKTSVKVRNDAPGGYIGHKS